MTHRTWQLWALPVCWTLLIWVGSSIAVLPAKLSSWPGIDKLVHFVEYGVLGFLLARAMSAHVPPLRLQGVWLLTVIGSMAYGTLDELHQMDVPTRSASSGDLIADTLGAAAGAWLLLRARYPLDVKS